MRIAIATDAWFPQTNGVVRSLATTITILQRRGYEIELITPNEFVTVPTPGYREIRLAVAPRFGVRKALGKFRPDSAYRHRRANWLGSPLLVLEPLHSIQLGIPYSISGLCSGSHRAFAGPFLAHNAQVPQTLTVGLGIHVPLDGRIEAARHRANAVMVEGH